MDNKAIFVLDGGDIIVVDSEKFLLVREVIKHYTPRWQGEAATAAANRQAFSIGETVKSMLKRLCVECVLNPEGMNVLHMDIIPENVPAAAPTGTAKTSTTTTTTPPQQGGTPATTQAASRGSTSAPQQSSIFQNGGSGNEG